MPTYPSHYHAAINALVRNNRAARPILALALREYRKIDRAEAIKFAAHAAHIGWPIRLRPNGRYL